MDGGISPERIHYTRGLFHGLPPSSHKNKKLNSGKPPLRNTVNKHTMANPLPFVD